MNPADHAVTITKVKTAAQRSPIIHYNDEKDANKLRIKTQNELGNEYEINTGKFINLRIKIVNIREADFGNEDEFITKFCKQNLMSQKTEKARIQGTVSIGWNIHKFF